jgi:5-methylcytosine-specific restriction endonuclease McrA
MLGRYRTAWKCLCDCGKKFVLTTKKIQQGTRKSCGCLSTSSWYKKMTPEHVVGGSKHGHYKASARRRNISWQLTKKEFLDLIFKNCHYCGSEPSLVAKASIHTAKVNGVDRVDSNKAYSLDNCVTCCRQCNCAKGAMSLEEFLKWIERLKKYENSSNIGHPLPG